MDTKALINQLFKRLFSFPFFIYLFINLFIFIIITIIIIKGYSTNYQNNIIRPYDEGPSQCSGIYGGREINF